MQEVFFLSSMDSLRFSSVFRCEVERRSSSRTVVMR